MVDGDGVTINLPVTLWFDDGHSVDGNGVPVWTAGNSPEQFVGTSVSMTVIGHNAPVVKLCTDVHVNKPKNPPDRG